MAKNLKKKFLEIFKILAKFLDHLNWKTKKKILEIISECHEMARNAKKNCWKFLKFWQVFGPFELKNEKKISGNHLRMSWNGEKCKKKLLEIFKILAKFLDNLNWKTKKNFFGNHLRMSWNGKKCKKKFWKFDSLSVVTSCQVVRKKFWLQKLSNGLWI